MLTQEIKWDIICRRMNLPPSAWLITDPQCLTAHLHSTLRQLHSYLQYIGLRKYAKATEMLQKMMEINLENPWKYRTGPNFLVSLPSLHLHLSWNHDTKILSHTNTTILATHAHSATHSYTTWTWAHMYTSIKYGPEGWGVHDWGGGHCSPQCACAVRIPIYATT